VATPTPTSIGTALHRFGLERDRLRATLCRSAGITLSELDALEHLEADGALTQRELGQRLALTSGGVTVLVDRLERAGWVRREPHPTDRRAVLLVLDDRALAALPAALAEYHAAVATAARAIPSTSRAAVEAFLASVAARAAATADALAGQA
jgi:DNA-binding MarR family transcriptional regulator